MDALILGLGPAMGGVVGKTGLCCCCAKVRARHRQWTALLPVAELYSGLRRTLTAPLAILAF